MAIKTAYADMAESADALDSGSSRGNSVEVQVLLSAPKKQSIPNGMLCFFMVAAEDLKARKENVTV